MHFAFEPIWPWPVVTLVSVGLLFVVWHAYRKRLSALPALHRRVLVGLRLATWLVLVWMMLRPAIETTATDKRGSVFVIATDRSRSMNIADGPAGATRRKSLIDTLTGVESELKALADEVDLRRFEFDKEVVAVETLPPEANGEQTAIGLTLDEIRKQTTGKRLAGVLLMGDGAQRALPPFDIDPRDRAHLLRDLQVPIHTVGFGASGLTGGMDLILEDLEVSPTVFVKNTLIASAKVRALGADKRDLAVRMLIEDRSTVEPGVTTPMKPVGPPVRISTDQNEATLRTELSWVPDQPGEYRLAVEVLPLEGEPVKTNNSLSTYVTVLKGGVRVAYFDKPRPEQKWLRYINDSPDIQVDFQEVRQGPLQAATPIDAKWIEAGKYDVFIIGDVPARSFGPDLLRKLNKLVEQGAGLMMTGGFRSFGPGGYATSPLADVLPVEMDSREIQNGPGISPDLHFNEPLKMVPTAFGLQSFIMRLDAPDKNLDRWKSLPPLQGANKLKLKDLARAIAESGDERRIPLLASLDFGRTRTLAFAGDTTYQWYLGGKSDEHQQFWQQTILWLAHKEEQGDNAVWVRLGSRRLRPGQPLDITVGARGPDKRPLTDAGFTIEVLGPKQPDQRWPVTPQKTGSDTTGRFTDTRQPGEYKVRVEATQDGKPLGGAQMRFMVYEQDLELHNPAADLVLLDELSRITGGTAVPPEQLGKFLKSLIKSGLNPVVTKVSRTTLWDNAWLMLAFVVLMTTEWFWRKSRGLV
jgi:uncharacterized membrane protein